MGELIIIVSFIGVFLSKLQGNKKKMQEQPKAQKVQTVRRAQTVQEIREVQQRTPEYRPKRREAAGKTVKKPDILERAAANVEEDFKEEKQKDSKALKAEGRTEQQIVQEADLLAEVDLTKIYEPPEMQQNSELMKSVSDLMAKGADTELSFQRDFVAEGMDMINNITL